MHGNVWQWCQDWYTERPPGGEDPKVTTAASNRVARGGGWDGLGGHCRSALRQVFEPGARHLNLGFRVAAVQSASVSKPEPLTPNAKPPETPAPATSLKPTETGKQITNSIGMKLVPIPAGKFMMGSPDSEANRQLNEQQHEVEITKPFYLGMYTVTQAEYEKVMGNNPSNFSATGGGKDKVQGKDTSQFPVETVSWNDAVEFCRKLSEMPEEKRPDKSTAYRRRRNGNMLVERGATTPFHYGPSLSSTQANFNGNYPYGGAHKGVYLQRTAQVGSYAANAFGLYDVHGNVYQWCQDWYTEKPPGGKDPVVTTVASYRVIRGGCWTNNGAYCRSARRSSNDPGLRSSLLGFRVAAVQSGG